MSELNTKNSSKTRRLLKVGYDGVCHTNCKTKVPTQSPCLHLKGNWLKEAGFDTGCGVTVKILQGCIVLMADNNELREELYTQ
ncbi:type I toxin-antitoxin system SymE family toxin [Salmonella enterica]|nr:type I toxin-antitoxin system SymE family toxin [Salmonella enterica]EBP7620687.1 type I toxin-antitoxin system SymE family toxin [Salmonella enterica]EDI7678489.1 hypothetical protein [Salmonella enterica]EDI8727503.1 hypothetical protein [Salmonella enterica]ELG4061410.1 type I toxin-antitoxin system SymE family toxin [Salmonella enterica]